ncbi:MAG: hypothetical protein GXP08_16780 [Gammaproteobacteria bacterium]|nr:hypothetical protein [Gammaproteobacteria bacterium]
MDNTTIPFILTHLEVFNWGPFSGAWCAEIDPNGSAIIGPTGSGKTTLVDALMTLIVARPRYNLASTGGHESDRDLLSYVRGVTGAGNSTDNDHIARQGKTTTGISARFSNGNQTIQIGAVLWIDGISFAAKDQKDLWLYTERDDQSLQQWLTLHQDGGTRALKQYGRETDKLRIFDTKKAYLAQLRQSFEVGENAFILLNRAAGLKQLNSIDEIFRELVLEDHSAFNRAAEVANEFDDLSAIHDELETARKQEQSLIPIARTHEKFSHCQTELDRYQTLLNIVTIWYASAAHTGWRHRAEEIEQTIDKLRAKIAEQEQQAHRLKEKADTLKEIYLKAGGTDIEQLKELISAQEKLLQTKRDHATSYHNITHQLDLTKTLTREALRQNQQQAKNLDAQLQAQLTQEEETLQTVAAELGNIKKREARYQDEITKIKQRPGSNIPARYQDFRTEFANALKIPEEQLPFVAQLLEVKTEEQAWRGAIERAIGANRLRILVPSAQMQAALAWVNSRDNRLHVRLFEAKVTKQTAQFLADGFTRKLNFKEHPYREALKPLLAAIDRHCVDSPEVLRKTAHGMTAQGLMSGRIGYFEKQDQQPLNKNWITGFDNKHRLTTLQDKLNMLAEEKQQQQQNHNNAKYDVKQTEAKLTLLTQLTTLDFDTIDSPSAEATLNDQQQRLALLTAPDSNVTKARQEYEQVEQTHKSLHAEINTLNEARVRQATIHESAIKQKESAFKRIGDGLSDEQLALAKSHLPVVNNDTHLDQLDQDERDERQRLEQARDKTNQTFAKLNKELVRLMASAQKVDNGALAETGTEIEDIPTYLERLKILTEEALPQKQARFLDYLTQSSDQGVTQLLTDIENEASHIEERIDELNQTLQRVDFQAGQYLQLVPQRVRHEKVSTLVKAQQRLRSAALKDDNGESHYNALKNVIAILKDASERKNTVAAKALLDPRHRLQFEAAILNRHNQKEIGKIKGSQSGSGGEKEIIASYILTASLSYALCPDGMTRPLFGTIVLDEAFSKSSQAVAGRIIAALREFGLHPLFVTPNKEMRLLRNHTRSAILVHRKGMKASLTSMSWEELENVAHRKINSTELKAVNPRRSLSDNSSRRKGTPF